MVKEEIKRQDLEAAGRLLWFRKQRLVFLDKVCIARQNYFVYNVMDLLPNLRVPFYDVAQKNLGVAIREMAFIFQIGLCWLRIIE